MEREIYRKMFVVFLILLILFGIGIRFASLNKDFSAEETDFVKSAMGIKETGSPRFYHSEQQPDELALWHPPMYIFLLSLVFKFFTGEIAVRMINVLFSFLTAGMIFLFCITILKKNEKLMGGICSAIFLINYYVFSSSILIDIDILSMFFVFSFISFILMYFKFHKNWLLVLAGICVFFGLANRYPIMGITYFFIGIYCFFNRDIKRYFRKYLLMGIIPGIIFLFIWIYYSMVVEPGNLFSFIIHNASLGSEQFSSLQIYLGSFALNVAQFVRLFTFPAMILLFLGVFYFLRHRNKVTDVLLIYFLVIFLFFIFVPRPAFGYPRYFATMLPGACILIGIFLYQSLRKIEIGKKELLIIVLSFIVSFVILIFLNPQATIYASNGLIKATNLPDFIFNLLASVPILFVFFVKKESRKKFVVLILIALMLSYCFYFDFKFVVHDSHIQETGDYLKVHTSEGEVLIVSKAIGYYADRKFYINDDNKPKLDFSFSHLQEYFVKSFENREMDDEFFWPDGFYSGIYDEPPANETLLKEARYVVLYHLVEGFEAEKIIGDFFIYKLK